MALAATPNGIYKSNDVNLSSPHWSEANPDNFAGPVIDMDFHPTENSIVFFCANANDIGRFFISGDSARSWIEMSEGLNSNIPSDISIDPANPDTFYLATGNGIYKMKNPVKFGTLPVGQTTTWGPGTVIVNGDVTVPPSAILNIATGTTVLFTYNFDRLHSGTSNSKSELIVQGTLNINLQGDQDHYVTLTSSRPFPNQAPGDWYGITVTDNAVLNMRYCNVEYANEGVYSFPSSTSGLPSNIKIAHCRFLNNSTAGIDLDRPSSKELHIDSSYFQSCNYYGIRIRRDDFTTIPACKMYADTSLDCQNGVWYVGNSNLSYGKNPAIYNGIFRYTLPNPTGYGIYVKLYSTPTAANVIVADSIVGFYTGIYLINVNNHCTLQSNKVKSNTYGLYLSGASPYVSNLQGPPVSSSQVRLGSIATI